MELSEKGKRLVEETSNLDQKAILEKSNFSQAQWEELEKWFDKKMGTVIAMMSDEEEV